MSDTNRETTILRGSPDELRADRMAERGVMHAHRKGVRGRTFLAFMAEYLVELAAGDRRLRKGRPRPVDGTPLVARVESAGGRELAIALLTFVAELCRVPLTSSTQLALGYVAGELFEDSSDPREFYVLVSSSLLQGLGRLVAGEQERAVAEDVAKALAKDILWRFGAEEVERFTEQLSLLGSEHER
jgi:hypothetical protein